jgi:hypothetical protein
MSSRHFIHAWNAASIRNQLTTEPEVPLNHLAADSYGAVEPGDVLWILGIGGHRAHLYYRFNVEKRVTQAQAERHFNGQHLWDAEFHFLGNGTPPLKHDITHLLPDLRFISDTRPRLLFDEEGHFSNQAFRIARQLERPSAKMVGAELAKVGVAV